MSGRALYVFAMAGDTGVVPVSAACIQEHLNNGIVQRLLGTVCPDDGLMERRPSRDEWGQYTIMQDLHIEATSLLNLLQFFRTGAIPAEKVQDVYEVSLRLGGFDRLDAWMRGREDTPATDVQEAGPGPQTPQDAGAGLYDWASLHMNHSEQIFQLTKLGWSATYRDESEGSSFHVYFRRLK